ncbi:uncharacterized protein STEHIDRAFT_126163 [Stereum hirsutum FP-91666 SS1]|uniref:Uncharacterized protein n=1 Tax=Stereum hirsutum (strain FP-91666) TaxID=721885 RepID=R7RZ40_STEHR|nr:uncharacterized protein STEHIDRAFT_126163 [Stereum hirsutum FP-91666 SS1]EIM80190.1 hypothetical protein STEHIDRAFT_126163 [Stereum hirsutum FP-91666 SS1]
MAETPMRFDGDSQDTVASSSVSPDKSYSKYIMIMSIALPRWNCSDSVLVPCSLLRLFPLSSYRSVAYNNPPSHSQPPTPWTCTHACRSPPQLLPVLPASGLPLDLPINHIVLLSSRATTLGPPQSLHSLLLTCRDFHSMLAVEPSSGLYAQIFDSQFDIAAPKRRLDPDAFSSSSRHLEMKRRFTAMQLFKRGDVYVGGDDKQLAEAFGVAYIMLLEDDGTNAGKLQGAGLVGFVEEWLEKRLCESEGGWPVDNEISALALNIFWQLTDKGMVSAEAKGHRDHIQNLLLPIVVVGSRYPIHLASPSHSSSTSFQRPRTITLPHFSRTITLTLPPLCLPAILSYVVRADCNPLNVPQYALNTRADAIAMGVNEPTVEDIVEHNEAMKTQCLEHPQWDVPQSRSSPRPSSPLSHPQQGMAGAPVFPFNEYQPLAEGTSKSERQDVDWARLTSTSASDYNDLSSVHSSSDYGHGPKGGASAYVLGSLTGSWRGTLMLPSLDVSTPETVKDPEGCITRRPLYVDLTEHWRTVRVPCEDADGVGGHEDVEKRGKESDGCKLEGWEDGEWSYRMNSSGDGIEVHTPSSTLQSSDAASPSTSTSAQTSPPQTGPKLTTTSYKTYTPFPTTFRPVPRSNDSPSANLHLMASIPRLIACASPLPLHEDTTVDATQAKVQTKMREVTEIVLTGRTPPDAARAWGDYDYFGKVRMSDGLVVLSRKPVGNTPGSRNTVFVGYLSSSQNLVGRWTFSTSTILKSDDQSWRGIFSLGRKEMV